MATVQATLNQINESLKSSGRHYEGYSCKTVSWDDVQRGTVGGELSCWGANITDTRLWAKDGRSLFTVRGNNWNERLGRVTADQIAVVANDGGGGGGASLRPYTLRTFLKDPARFGAYAGLRENLDLSDANLDSKVSVRFQTTFLPVDAKEKAALEFAPESYNYNTTTDTDPRNIILLSTTQGLAVQQDGAGAKKLYHHAKNSDGTINRYWLEAERTMHKVGGSQTETQEERDDAVARGKATASVIGVAGMGTRFNVLMTIQIPLKPKEKPRRYFLGSAGAAGGMPLDMFSGASAPGGMSVGMSLGASAPKGSRLSRQRHVSVSISHGRSWWDVLDDSQGMPLSDPPTGSGFGGAPNFGSGSRALRGYLAKGAALLPVLGISNAARVSKGSFVDKWNGLTAKEPRRHPSEHITVTIVLYYVCSGGVPTSEDVKAAVDDLEDMYKSVESGRLEDDAFDFMKSELTVKDAVDIETKLTTQPPPKPEAPSAWNVFPTSG